MTRTVVQIKVTPEQKAEIDRRAHEARLTMSEYIRHRALEGFDGPTDDTTFEETVKPLDPGTGKADVEPSDPAPMNRADRIAQRTAELRAEGVSTYATMDQAEREVGPR